MKPDYGGIDFGTSNCLGANGNYRKALTFVRHELAVVMGADDVILEAITSSDMDTWTPATLVSDVPSLTGRATRTWQCGASDSRRALRGREGSS